MTTAQVSIVGASGRVGSALVGLLGDHRKVAPVTRMAGEAVDELAARAAGAGDVIVNAAGVAHVAAESPAELERLRRGNVELPIALARAALDRRRPLIHISSVKATPTAGTAYGATKYEGEMALHRLGPQFAAAGLQLVIVKPLALLLPPFDAGKMSKLRLLRWVPRGLVPPLTMPVVATSTFVSVIGGLVDDALDTSIAPGVRVYDFQRSQRGTMRDVHDAISDAERSDHGS